eukprot:gnl/Spiro4/23224_TR11474_c0_g1_i1.p2 gnl/Spiro4/23224_TR11474_c0_g1~~gnl/Spiro4/23224_TR11474_c0_g1_i1.p2  ORF type:complete len:105 (-),score=28.89 gnl/Spiro4/23224_TR11474_c0_g1_i1:63-377(-)
METPSATPASATVLREQNDLTKLQQHSHTDHSDDTVTQQDIDRFAASAASGAVAERERQLATVTVDKAHVQLIVSEFDLTAAEAERRLRENRGDCVATMHALIH